MRWRCRRSCCMHCCYAICYAIRCRCRWPFCRRTAAGDLSLLRRPHTQLPLCCCRHRRHGGMLQRVGLAAICRLRHHRIPLRINNDARIRDAARCTDCRRQLPGCRHVTLHGRHFSRRQLNKVWQGRGIWASPRHRPVLAPLHKLLPSDGSMQRHLNRKGRPQRGQRLVGRAGGDNTPA